MNPTASTATAARIRLAHLLPVLAASAANASSIKSDHVRGLRVMLAMFADNICAGCGRNLVGLTVELCHIIPSTNNRTGYDITPGGVYAGCKSCNTYDIGKTASEIVASMVRPDLVSMSHPDRKTCLMSGGHDVEIVTHLRDNV